MNWKNLLFFTIFFAILGLIFWYQISPMNLAEYNRICVATNSDQAGIDRCLKPFRQEQLPFTIYTVILSSLSILSLILAIIDITRKVRRRDLR